MCAYTYLSCMSSMYLLYVPQLKGIHCFSVPVVKSTPSLWPSRPAPSPAPGHRSPCLPSPDYMETERLGHHSLPLVPRRKVPPPKGNSWRCLPSRHQAAEGKSFTENRRDPRDNPERPWEPEYEWCKTSAKKQCCSSVIP